MNVRRDHVAEVRSALTDARRFCSGLGLLDGSKPNGRGVLIRCPSHGDRDPSCSITNGPDGTLRAVCFACDFKTDALGVIAVVRGLSTRSDFREILAEGAQLAGLYELEAEILDGQPRPDRPRVPPPEPVDERTYAPASELLDTWAAATPAVDDPEVSGYLVGRQIDPEFVTARSLGRVLAAPAPRWARHAGRTWLESGHRLIVRAFDPEGRLMALRACRVRDGESPKRLPPSGHKTAGLCMLNAAAWRMLARGDAPGRVIVVEGEPDFLVAATHWDGAVLGVFSGSWTDQFAAAVPRDALVYVRTHEDEAGDRYARKVIDSLAHKCSVFRSKTEVAA